MRKDHTAILIALDETASMEVVRDATIGAFNEFISSQQQVTGTAEVWIQRFNSSYRRNGFNPEVYTSILDVPSLDRQNYRPREMTPLYDAVGQLLDRFVTELKTRDDKDKPEKVIVVIQTDGQDNESGDYTREKLNNMIKYYSAEGWQFTYLGANQDAWEEGQSIGIPISASMSYDHTDKGTFKAFADLSKVTAQYRTGQQSKIDYGDQSDA